MELLLLGLLALDLPVFVGYPVNGHGSGYYPYFGPDGDRGSRPGSRSDDLRADDRGRTGD